MNIRDANALQTASLETPTELGSNVVRDVSVALNVLLADMFALYVKTKNFHWHMSGRHFRDYHLLLDEQAEPIFATTDASPRVSARSAEGRCDRLVILGRCSAFWIRRRLRDDVTRVTYLILASMHSVLVMAGTLEVEKRLNLLGPEPNRVQMIDALRAKLAARTVVSARLPLLSEGAIYQIELSAGETRSRAPRCAGSLTTRRLVAVSAFNCRVAESSFTSEI
jgi:starvation-inducible DNA-binding protein